MKKLAAAGFGVALAAATLTISPQAAKADSPVLVIGGVIAGLIVGHHLLRHAGPHPHHHAKPLHIFHPLGTPHVLWCEDRFQTYNRYTDLYYYAPGKQRHCKSPYSG